jgi:hypothetical protein
MEISPAPKKSLGARFLSFLLTIAIGYILALVLVRIFEAHFIFFPNTPGRFEGDWHPRALPVEDVWLTSSDGTQEASGSNPDAPTTYFFVFNLLSLMLFAPKAEFESIWVQIRASRRFLLRDAALPGSRANKSRA